MRMSPIVTAVTYLMGVGTLVINLALIIFIIGTFVSPVWREWLHEKVGSHGALVSFGILAASLVGSLFYSEVAGFAACIVCWVIRILLYPQIVLVGAYLYKPRRWLMVTSLVMSIGAFVSAIYLVYLQYGGSAIINCGLFASLGSCETEYFRIFGYVTIATMTLVSTAALVVCQAVSLHRKHYLKQVAS